MSRTVEEIRASVAEDDANGIGYGVDDDIRTLLAALDDGERTYAKRWRRTAFGMVERELRSVASGDIEILLKQPGQHVRIGFCWGESLDEALERVREFKANLFGEGEAKP